MAETPSNYAIITGQGRSGTNWLLELLDQSPRTFCRNEPYGPAGSPMAELPDRLIVRNDFADLAGQWDDVLDFLRLHFGDRDQVLRAPKFYKHRISEALGLWRWMAGRRRRRLVTLLGSPVTGSQWQMPWWLGSRTRLRQALLILKLVQSPGWVAFVMRHHPNVPIFHITRHPGGFLNSWRNRWLAGQDEADVTQLNRQRLHDVAAETPQWGQLFGHIDEMGADEAELWYWRYANETLFELGRSSPRYLHIVYEQLAAEPVPIMQRIYQMCELEWTDAVQVEVERVCSSSGSIAAKWRGNLTPDRIELVKRILAPSPMASWWSGSPDQPA